MKKTLITLLALSGFAMAGVQQNADGTLQSTGGNYVYTWQLVDADTGSWGWKYLPGTKEGELSGPTSNFYPAGSGDIAIVGYTYDATTGLFTPSSDAISGFTIFNAGYHNSHLYLGGSYTSTGGDFLANQTIHLAQNTTVKLTSAIGLKNPLTFDYGNMTNSSSLVQHTSQAIWMTSDAHLTLSGTYTTAAGLGYGDMFEKTIFSTTGSYNGGSLTTDNIANNFEITTADGVVLENIGVITDISELAIGQSAILWKDNVATLVGAVVPEPTTATLSLLALAGLAARRRRK